MWEPEGFFLLASRRPELAVEVIAAEFGLETLRDYLARSVRMREAKLNPGVTCLGSIARRVELEPIGPSLPQLGQRSSGAPL